MLIVLAATVCAAATAEPGRPTVRIGSAAYYESCPADQKAISFYRQAYGHHRSQMGLSGPVPRVWYGCDAAARRAVAWRERAAQARTAMIAWQKREGRLGRLVVLANRAIADGQAYSTRWGDASPWLRSLCYQIVDAAFRPYGTQEWARYVVNRESGCNPHAVNSRSGASGIAQYMPRIHTWVDYGKLHADLGYAIKTFLRMSRGGHSTGPWQMG